MAKVTNKQIKNTIKELQLIGCCFWACDGDNKPFINMKTCRTCYIIKDMRYWIDGKPRLPDHDGYKGE